MLDGAVLSVLLARVRRDAKVMTNFLLEGVPELEQHCIFVDPLQTAGFTQRNRRAVKEAIAVAGTRWHAGDFSGWRSIPLANATSSDCGPAME
jgi:hypothetical protein